MDCIDKFPCLRVLVGFGLWDALDRQEHRRESPGMVWQELCSLSKVTSPAHHPQ